MGLGGELHGSKDWTSRQEKPPVFDIMSTVKKSQKRPREEAPFQVYQPPVVNADEEYDKENMPVSYERQFSRRSEPQQRESEAKRLATDTYHSMVADIDMDDDGSLTKQDSEYIQQLLASQTHSRKSSASVNNRISDQDDTHSFMTGRRDTADMRLLMGLQELIDKSNDTQ